MDNEYSDIDTNKNICQAVGCFAKATDKIALEGGTYGVISVMVCRNCIGKFQDDSAHDTNELSSTTRSSKVQARCEQ